METIYQVWDRHEEELLELLSNNGVEAKLLHKVRIMQIRHQREDSVTTLKELKIK